MNLIVDTHVHIYPFYAIEVALASILDNFNRIDSDAVKVACLTERYDCNLFDQLASNPPEPVTKLFDISPSDSGNSLRIRSKNGSQEFYLLPGQQIITAENLEVLSLNCPQRVAEGKTAAQTIHDVIACNGIPIVAWGLGKWLFKRGNIVGKLIDDFNPNQFAIGDTTMRPNGWMTPLLMRKAKSRGYKILFGSDPLPFRGEEIRLGSYACKLESSAKSLPPEEAIRGILSPDINITPVGKRCSIAAVTKRTLNHRQASNIAETSFTDHQSDDSTGNQFDKNMNLLFEAFSGKKVLVTGATGFSGRVITQKLIDSGAKVSAIARMSSELGNLESYDIEWHRGDVFDAELVAEATQGVQYIFHLAAAFREEKANDEIYRTIHVESTKLLAKSVVGKEGFECFVHVSTVGVHGHIEVERGDEEYRFSPGDGYQRTKLEAELWLKTFAGETKLPYTVVRPTPIFGPGDMRLLKLFRMIKKGYLLMLGKGEGIYHLIHVDDLSNIILLAGITPAARSEVMIAANDDPITIVNMGRVIAKKINVNKLRIVRLPLFPFYLASDICKIICTPFGIEPPIYRRRVDFYTKDRQFDNSKVKQLLDYEFKFDNDSGIEDTANWYMKNSLLN